MIEIGYNFLKKDLIKIQKFKNPTLDIDKNRIKKIQIIKYFLIRINIIIRFKMGILNINQPMLKNRSI